MNPLTDALASLITSALPMLRWLRWLRDEPRPPYTPHEAALIDAYDEAWTAHRESHHGAA